MWQAMAMLAWLVGTVFGALWASSLEREEEARARLYGFYMAYLYFTGVVLMGFAPIPAGWWTALVMIVVVVFFATVAIIGRRRLRQ
jgi:predicted tellurium resistance membrane protein TerC